MTDVGGVYTQTLSLSASSFTSVTAPTGEQIKITLVYAKDPNNNGGFPANDSLSVAPATGGEQTAGDGTTSKAGGIPPIGGNAMGGSNDVDGLQPIFITDADPLYVGNSLSDSMEVFLQGVRVA